MINSGAKEGVNVHPRECMEVKIEPAFPAPPNQGTITAILDTEVVVTHKIAGSLKVPMRNCTLLHAPFDENDVIHNKGWSNEVFRVTNIIDDDKLRVMDSQDCLHVFRKTECWHNKVALRDAPEWNND